LARLFDLKFLFVVFVPTLLAALYYGLVASDVYMSESRFVVRSPQRQQQGTLGALLAGSSFSRSADDTYSVNDFMSSRDALRELNEKLKIQAAFEKIEIDPINRFPSWDRDRSFEAFYRYYLDHVFINYDATSSISVLQVRAFSAADAKNVNELLLEMGERLLNNMNQRSRQDLIEAAERDVRMAEERAKLVAAELASFRSDRSVLDPTAQGVLQLQGVAKAEEDLAAAEGQLAELRQVSPNNPQVELLERRVQSLRTIVGQQNSRLLGKQGGLASKSPAYDRLTLEKGFAERQLAASLAALDAARSEAVRKQLYLERLVQPNLPDTALEPRRFRGVLSVLVVAVIAWGVLSLIVAGIREHIE
jgi:capsular polysaccharide transport system permease protein